MKIWTIFATVVFHTIFRLGIFGIYLLNKTSSFIYLEKKMLLAFESIHSGKHVYSPSRVVDARVMVIP